MKKKMVLVGVVVTLAVVFLFGAAPAFAATGPGNGFQGKREAPDTTRLENVFKREQTILVKQQERLVKAEQIAAKTQDWIDKLQEDGKDTDALEAALEDFVSALYKAKGYLETAASTLATHAGFNGDGNVTDSKQALKTVRDAGKAQRQFHLIISKAATDFRDDVRKFREGLK
jgi:hypothetical protein